MTASPSRPEPPVAMIAIAALLALAVVGAAFGALTRPGTPEPTAAATSVAVTPTPSTTPAVVVGGSAWAPATPTPVVTPVPPTPSPTPPATPAPPAIEASLAICDDVRNGRCVDERRRVGDRGFVVVLAFSDSAPGDIASFRLEGPGGQVVKGADITLGGGQGRAWATFRGGLARGDWLAVAAVNGSDVARAEFEAR